MDKQLQKQLEKVYLTIAPKISKKEMRKCLTPQTFENNEEAKRKFYEHIEECDERNLIMKKNEYKCAMCGNTYKKEWSDKEAMQECIDNFGEMAIFDNCDIVCDDCYNIINPNEHPAELEKAKTEFYGL